MSVLRLRRSRIALVLAAAAMAFAGGELAIRLFERLRSGQWPSTERARVYDAAQTQQRLYRVHPFLNTAPRPGGHGDVEGRQVSFNSLGYRSPERPAAKPAGTIRILCAGGSTTFDLLAPSDERTWPRQMEDALRRSSDRVEVWNAGLPGWSSVENTISLASRDVDLSPDLVVLFQGIEDLQPAAVLPFDPQYETGHSDHSRHLLGLPGFGAPPVTLPWYGRSLVVEKLGLALDRGPARKSPPAARRSARRPQVSPAGLRGFERNIRSFAAVARARGIPVALVTQTLRVRDGHEQADLQRIEETIPGLRPEAAAGELGRFNDVLRGMVTNDDVIIFDAARDVPWADDDFGDPFNLSAAGSTKLAAYLTARIGPLMSPSTVPPVPPSTGGAGNPVGAETTPSL